MRTIYPTGTRIDPVDRTPESVILTYGSAPIAPHVLTTRWTHTVPANRNALVTNLFVSFTRTTVAAPAGGTEAAILVDDGATIGYLASCYMIDLAVNATRTVVIPAGAIFLPGTIIYATTSDSSTGGSLIYRLTATLVEYDA